jgi:hypothetical protein
MASRKQVEAKALKLGGKLVVDLDSATLESPEGMHLDGYHSQVSYFDEGKQNIWDAYWLALKNVEVCDCAEQSSGKPSAWEIKFRASMVAALGEDVVREAEAKADARNSKAVA